MNTEHNLSLVDGSLDITLNTYYLKVNTAASFVNSNGVTIQLGKNRTAGNNALYLADATNTGGSGVIATNNIPYEVLTPIVEQFIPTDTSVSARVRTISGTSINAPTASSISFLDQGFNTIELNTPNYFTTPRLIASIPNQDTHLRGLPGRRSLTLELTMRTSDPDVSPVIDLDRVLCITTTNKINNPYDDVDQLYVERSGVKRLFIEDHDCTYASKIVQLQNPATSLQLELLGYRPADSNIRAQFRLFRSDSPTTAHDFSNFNRNGRPDTDPGVSATTDPFITDYDDYKWTANGLPAFNAFQIRIIMTSTNQALPPRIKDLRVIALA